MQGVQKKVWSNQIQIKSGADVAVAWLLQLKERGYLNKGELQPFFSYVIDKSIPLDNLLPLSGLYKFSNKDNPQQSYFRNLGLKLLSTAMKVHFLLNKVEKIEFEPYYSLIPNLNKINESGMILYYTFGGKTIIVSNLKLDYLFGPLSGYNVEYIPLLLNNDTFKWFSLKEWYKIDSYLNYDTFIKKVNEVKTINDLFAIANIVDVPYKIKEEIKILNVFWHKEFKVWFTPKWEDVGLINSYVKGLIK